MFVALMALVVILQVAMATKWAERRVTHVA